MLLQIHHFDLRRVWTAHHPAVLGPDQRSLEILLRFVLDVLRIDAEVNGLSTGVGGSVPEWFARIVPDPPLALYVVGVGNFPVRRAGQRDARDSAILADSPNAPRRETEIRPPNFFRLQDIFAAGSLCPTSHALRPAQNGFTTPPRRIARQSYRMPRLTRIFDHEPSAINRSALEDVSVKATRRGGLPGRIQVPWMMFPGGCRRLARISVVTGLEINKPEGVAFLEHERPRLPFQIAFRIDLSVCLLPAPTRRPHLVSLGMKRGNGN